MPDALGSLNGTTGFRLDGIDAFDRSGFAVAPAGDVNGNGLADLVIGAPGAGENYVVFGKAADFASAIDLGSLNGTTGFRLDGSDRSVASAGDVNGDGFGDIITGAPGGGYSGAGVSYVVFG